MIINLIIAFNLKNNSKVTKKIQKIDKTHFFLPLLKKIMYIYIVNTTRLGFLRTYKDF